MTEELAKPLSMPGFDRFGRGYHLRIGTADDLLQVLHLDEAHWVATSAPIQTINADSTFLKHLDADCDDRVRVTELREAIRWLLAHSADEERIATGARELSLSSIRVEAPQGAAILRSATKVRDRSGTGERDIITLDQVRRIKRFEEEGSLGKRGVVLPSAAPDERSAEFLKDVVATTGGEKHPGGEMGVTGKSVDEFMGEAQTFLEWRDRAALAPDGPENPIMPLKGDTPEAYRSFEFLRERIDQYFALCHLNLLAPLLADHVEPGKVQPESFEFSDPAAIEAFLADAPLAAPQPEAVLGFDGPINPYYAVGLSVFRERFLGRLADGSYDQLTLDDWNAVKARFAPHREWVESRPETAVELIPEQRLRGYRDNPRFLATAKQLIEESHKRAFVLEDLRLVEKLLLYQAYLLSFANSFVSFPDLYDPQRRALFEMGTLIMDGRHFTLCVRVPDRAQHAKLVKTSNIFVLYAEISAHGEGPPYVVAVPVTSGGRGKLGVDKWGLFQDRRGTEHHARVVEIVENPISLKEAVTSPFLRLGSAITGKLQEITAEAEEKLASTGQETVAQVTDVLQKPVPAKQGAVGMTGSAGGMLAGGGIAIAALGSSAAFITKTLAAMTWQKVLGGLVAAIAAVMLPTTLVAYQRLRKRDLSTVLEGAGWAINARMWLTGKQARTFSYRPRYARGIKGLRFLAAHWYWLLIVAALLGTAYSFTQPTVLEAVKALLP